MLPSRLFLNDFFDDFDKPERNLMQCDISEKDGKYFIEMDMPGMKKEDISMDIDDGYLKISVESKVDENTNDDKKYIHRERHSYTNCSRKFYVGNIDADLVKASFKDGILTVSFPKEEKKETRKIIYID